MQYRVFMGITLCCITLVQAQYTAEWTSGDLGQYGYGGAYGYDIDEDGLVEYYVRQVNQIRFYNGDYTVEWSVSIPGYDYVNVVSPRDIDGNGICTPLNTDNDAAGEIIITAYYYNSGNYTYYGRFRVYDAATRVMEYESPQITGFYGSACQEDLDGDGRDEIVLTRFGSSTTSSYVVVYAYTGTGLNEGSVYSAVREFAAMPNPSVNGSAILFTVANSECNAPVRVAIYDIAGRCIRQLYDMERGVPGLYELQWDGKDAHETPVPSGTYLITVTKGGSQEDRQIQIVR